LWNAVGAIAIGRAIRSPSTVVASSRWRDIDEDA